MNQEFLGSGWQFPVQLTDRRNAGEQRGEIAFSHEEQRVQESIWIILSTAPGERLMRPEFGCDIHNFVFAPNDTRTIGLIRFRVEEALLRWEPRIDLLDVQATADSVDPTVLFINIDYRVRATDSRFNLVYPFYLQREPVI